MIHEDVGSDLSLQLAEAGAAAAEADEDAVAEVRRQPSYPLPRHAGRARNGYRTASSDPQADEAAAARNGAAAPTPPGALALFCYEAPDSPVGRCAGNLALVLARRQTPVYLFSRDAFDLAVPGVTVRALGEGSEGSLLDRVQEFNRRACNAFLEQFPAGTAPAGLLGCEWSTVPALSLLHATRGLDAVLSLHSLERQRGDLASDLSRGIADIERTGLREARAVLAQNVAVAEVARQWLPECAGRTALVRPVFPVERFTRPLDPGAVKARYQVGPIDPLVLYIGDLDQRHGPDVVMKSVPPVLKNHKQTRFAFVGCGDLYWPLRVHARYLLLEHAVRLLGDVQGEALEDLIQAADVVVVPSREQTEWWPVQVGWAAGKPVVVSRPVAESMRLRHEQDAVTIYPHESSCVWGLERVLFDAGLRAALADAGRQQLDERFGGSIVAGQVLELLGVAQQ